MSGIAWRATDTSEYALMSSASRKPSRGVSMNGPPRSSLLAKAIEWTITSTRPSSAFSVSNALSTLASSLTSHSNSMGSEDSCPPSLSTPLRTLSLM